MDISAYDYDGPLEYFLGCFNIQERFASQKEIRELTDPKKGRFGVLLHSLVHRHPPRPRSFVKWNRTGFNPSMLSLPDNVYVEGYWCSEKYFKDIEAIIREEFTFREPPHGRNLELAKEIEENESVSVHVRRGDYVADEKAGKTHGTCGQKYYRECVQYVRRKRKSPKFFVFSDEPLWCRQNLAFMKPATFVDGNALEPWEDMRLMSLCHDNIIANSTFSWWGAWLNGHDEKVVIAPKKWYAGKKFDPDDIFPPGWIRK
jgi:hypothetical protein